jgi:pyridoxal phosphate-dependent aminotransferase EpsN
MSKDKHRIFLSPPHMGGDELELINEAFRDNYIAPVGPHIDAFEREMEAYLGQGHCVAVSSGTAALHLALRIIGSGPGDEIPCSDMTFIASSSPIVFMDAQPVFIDAEPRFWNMDPELLQAYLKRRQSENRLPKALVLVHLYGQPAMVGDIAGLCQNYGVNLVEDAAEALGSDFNGRKLGTFGRFGVLSFNGNKIITTSGGGMLICRDEQDAAKARHLATQAREPAPHYEHTEIGFNYRMSNVCAAIGRGQLRVLDTRVCQKRAVFEGYRQRLSDLGIIHFQGEPGYGLTNRWLTCATFLEPGQAESAYALREKVRLTLEDENIESRPLWKPMHMQPVFKDMPCLGGSIGEDLFSRGLCLPSGTAMTEDDLDRICGVIRKALV